MIYQLKITLKGCKPPIWRRIQVDSRTTFHQLHQIIQIAFDWSGEHLHKFEYRSSGRNLKSAEEQGDPVKLFDLFASGSNVDQERAFIGDPHEDIGHQVPLDEYQETLADWLLKEKDKCLYIYDFGDNWRHGILLEKILPPERKTCYPVCVKARREAPWDSRGFYNPEIYKDPTNEKLAFEINRILQERREQLSPTLELVEQSKPEKRHFREAGLEKPAIKQWKDLFDLAICFKELKCWEWMSDVDVFAVKDAESGLTGYCSVMGQGGTLFGLAVYIGDEGLISLIKTLEDEFQDEDMYEQRSLLLSFEDPKDLDKEDYELIKSLGLRFRGKKEWPSFRSYAPGYYPWVLDRTEVSFFTKVLEQAIHVSQRVKENPELLIVDDGYVFARCSVLKNNSLNWEDACLEAEAESPFAQAPPLTVDELELFRLKKAYDRKAAVWEFDLTYFPAPVQEKEDERPYFPLMGMWVDGQQGLVLDVELMPHGSGAARMQEKMCVNIERMGWIPKTIRVKRPRAYYVLAPIAEKFDIHLELVPQLLYLEALSEELLESILPG